MSIKPLRVRVPLRGCVGLKAVKYSTILSNCAEKMKWEIITLSRGLMFFFSFFFFFNEGGGGAVNRGSKYLFFFWLKQMASQCNF